MGLHRKPARFRVLMVCMGNICRSPTAEAVLRATLAQHAPDLDVTVDSAGTHGYHVGEAPDSRAIAHARRRGVDLSTLRARRLEPADFARFDYILCMDEANIRAAERVRPPAAAAHLGLLLTYAQNLTEQEVPDPYYGGPEDFERVLDLVERGSLGLIEELRRVGRSSSKPT